jgi:tetratricopeptide (TPR) repeat protein
MAYLIKVVPARFLWIGLLSAYLPLSVVFAQSASSQRDQSIQGWVDRPIVMLRGFGSVHQGKRGSVTTAVGINIVSVVSKVVGQRLWVSSTGGDSSGWVDVRDVVPLPDSISYFNSLIARNDLDWDAYLRRAEAEHALNQGSAATSDYAKAIELHPNEAFLYLRRGRHYNTLKDCKDELADFETAIKLAASSAKQGYNLTAELYSLESGVYSSCPDTSYRDPRLAISTARHAVSLDGSRPTLRTILATALANSGDYRSAVKYQRKAINSLKFPPRYLEDAKRQLNKYEQSLAAEQTQNPQKR